jgi:hypothetical protein
MNGKLIMPKFCIGCNETKSKSLFFKGRIVCKECDKDRKGTSIATSTDVADDGIPTKVDVIYDAIPKIFEKLETISRELQDVRNGLNVLQNAHKKTESVPEKLDMLSTKLGLLEELSTKLVASNALRNLSAKLVLPCKDIGCSSNLQEL